VDEEDDMYAKVYLHNSNGSNKTFSLSQELTNSESSLLRISSEELIELDGSVCEQEESSSEQIEKNMSDIAQALSNTPPASIETIKESISNFRKKFSRSAEDPLSREANCNISPMVDSTWKRSLLNRYVS
jgi:hypothetical protein